MKPSIFIFLIFTALFQWGCTQVTVRTELPQIESPEVVGKMWGFGFNTGMVTTHKVTLSDSSFITQPFDIKPYGGTETGIYGGLQLGIFEKFQVGYNVNVTTGQSFLKGQYQFLGDPFHNAKEGNVSGSVFLRAGAGNHSSETTFMGNTYSSEVKSKTFGFGASVGYRVSEKFLVFGGYAADQNSANAKLDNEDFGGGTYHRDIDGFTQVIGGGIQFGTRVALRLNANYVMPDWDNVDKDDFGTPFRADGQFSVWF